MPTTYINATDEMFTIVKAILDDLVWLSVFGYVMDVRWPGDARSRKPDMDKVWARVSKQIVTDNQASLANANGEQVYEAIGLLFIQLFCPRNQPATLRNTQQLAVAMQRAFYAQSPTGELWFRNATIRELPETAENYPINVVVTFQYRTLKSGASNGATFIPPTVPSTVLAVIPFTGAVDGLNKTFVLSLVPALLLVFGDGLLWQVPNHYSIVGNTITTVTAPSTLLILGE